MIKVTYQKANGEIFERIRNTLMSYRIGDTTSIGWRVLNIEYRYNNKYYSKEDYDSILDKEFYRTRKNNKIKKTFYNIYRELVYSVVLFLFIRVLVILSKMSL